MATQPLEGDMIEEEEQPEGEALDIQPGELLAAIIETANLVPMLDASKVNLIGGQALDEYKLDERSREEWLQRYDRAMDLAMQVAKEKTWPWPGAANLKFPLLTQAAIQFQARAYPAIVDGSNLVKGRVTGPDPGGSKAERAERIGQHMTWQLLYDMPGWEEDTDKLLLRLPIIGCVFRKSWYDPVQRRNIAETVPARDFVVNYWCTGLDKAPRYTHIQRYYPHEIEEYIRSGMWERVHYEGDDGEDPSSLVEVYEQHRLIDLDDDGYPEPYVVTFTKDGAVFRIVACFDQDGVTLTESGEVVRIERRKYFVKYGFIPAPDGSFYDIGFGTLLDNISAAIDTILNQLVDAGTLANMQGGFMAGGVKIKGGNMRFTPGEWKRVEGPTAGPLRDSIVPLQLPGPQPVLFQLLGMLIEAARDITSVQDILTGSQDSQTAPTTALALIEQGQKVFTAIYKRIHRSFGEELIIQRDLNRDNLDEEQYFNLTDTPGQIGRADYQDKDLDVVPVSDPTAVNDMQKMAKAQVLMAHNGDPLINQMEIRRRTFEAAGIGDLETLFDVPQQPPPPEAIKAMAETDALAAKTKAEVRNKDADTAKILIEAATAAYKLGAMIADPNIQMQTQAMLNEAIALADTVSAEMRGENGQPANEQGGVPEMEGQSGDAGLPPLPAGPGGGLVPELGAEPLQPAGGAAGEVPGGNDGGLGGPVL